MDDLNNVDNKNNNNNEYIIATEDATILPQKRNTIRLPPLTGQINLKNSLHSARIMRIGELK